MFRSNEHQDILRHLDLSGFSSVISFFGEWPSFHEAEVVGLELRKSGVSALHIHAFLSPKEKHGVVSILFDEIVELGMRGFNHENVLNDLVITKEDDDLYEIRLKPCSGLEGFIVGRGLRLQLTPGAPHESAYQKQREGLL